MMKDEVKKGVSKDNYLTYLHDYKEGQKLSIYP